MNKLYKKCICIFFSTLLCLSSSCDAPHSNPFDPENPEGLYSKLEGYAKSITPPYLPLQGVRVSISGKSNIYTETAPTGYFSFLNLERISGTLIFQKDGYLTDTLKVQWNEKREISVECFLKKIPSLDSLSVFSVVENHYENWNFYKLSINARINDFGSNDIDSLIAYNDELNFRQVLFYNPEKRLYEKTVTYKNQEDIEKFIGKKIMISAIGRTGGIYQLGSSFLKRIITQEVVLESPANSEQTSRIPVFTWRSVSPGFKFTYSIQVFANTIPPQLSAEAYNIPADQNSYSFKDQLEPGEYFWFTYCTDEFLNAGQSKPATFTVK
ncbi:MAG: hypothetical protein ACM3MI_02505 [Clostridiales bacterium]